MNFGPTTISQTVAALRKEPRKAGTPHALRCDRPALEHAHAASPRSHLDSPIYEAGRRHSQELGGLRPAPSLEPEDWGEYRGRTARLIQQLKLVLDARPEQVDTFAAFKEQSAQYVSHCRRHGDASCQSFTEVYGVITSLMGFQNESGFGRRPFPEHVRRSSGRRLQLAEQALQAEAEAQPASAP